MACALGFCLLLAVASGTAAYTQPSERELPLFLPCTFAAVAPSTGRWCV